MFTVTLHILLERVECVINNKALECSPGFFRTENWLGVLVLGVRKPVLGVLGRSCLCHSLLCDLEKSLVPRDLGPRMK